MPVCSTVKCFEQLEPLIDWDDQTWEQLILLTRARQKKVKITDQDVIQFIAKYPYFSQDGKFDFQMYRTIIRRLFYVEPPVFEESIRETMMVRELLKQANAHIQVDEEEILKAYKDEKEKVQLVYIMIPFEQFKEEIKLKDSELLAYFENHKQDFKIPPTINVEYIRMDFPEEGGIQKQVETKFKARAIYDEYAKNPDLGQLATKFKYTLQETGYFSKEEPDKEMGLTPNQIWPIFNMKKGELQYPMETPQGWILFRVKDIRGSYLPKFHEAYDKVSETFQKIQLKDYTKNQAESLWKDIQGNLSEPSPEAFQTVIAEQPYAIKEVPLLSKQQLKAYIEIDPQSDTFVSEIDTSSNLLPPLMTAKGVAIAYVLAYEPIPADELAASKDSFREQYIDEIKLEATSKFIEELKAEAQLKQYF